MRKLNGKLFLGLLIGAGLCTGTVFAVHHFQYQRIAQSLLWQAQHAADQGQVDRQARYLAHYLELNPRDDTEKAHLACLWAGDAFAASPKTRLRAVRMLDDVLTRNDDQPELRRTLIRLALELNVLDLARGHLEKLLPWQQMQKHMAQKTMKHEAKVDEGLGELESFWGQLLERENKQPADAARCYELALGHAPKGITSYIRRAYLLRRLDVSAAERDRNERDANLLIDDLVKNNQDNPLVYQAYLARWQYHRDFGLISLSKDQPAGRRSLVEAGDDISKALKRAPEDVPVLLAAADRERLEVHVAEADRELSSGQREARIKDHSDRAYEFLQKGLTLLKAQGGNDGLRFQLLWHKTNLLLDELRRHETGLVEGKLSSEQVEHLQARESEAAEAIEQIRKTRGLPASSDYLRARLLAHQRRWAEATALFEHVRPVLSSQPDLASDINLYLARCYRQLEEPGRALEAYQRMAAADPRQSTVLSELGMAQSEWEMGRLDEAARRFQGLINRHQLPDQAWPDVARLLLQRQAQEDQPDWRPVEQALRNAEQVLPTSIDVPLLRSQMYVFRKDPARAEKVLEEARRQPHWARAVEIRTALLMLALQKQQPDLRKAALLLDEAEKDLGDSATLRLARARYYTTALRKQQAAAAIDKLAVGLEHMAEQDQSRLLSGLADAHLSLENFAAARRLWQQLAEMPGRRTDLGLHMLLFDLAMKEKDEEGIQKALKDIESAEGPRGAYHYYGKALYLIWQFKKSKRTADDRQLLEQARAELDRALDQRSSWPPVFLARAEIHLLNSGDVDLAINDLRQATSNGEKSPLVIRQLVELLVQKGRYNEAEIELKRLRSSLLGQADLGRLAVVVALHKPSTTAAQAEEMIRKAVKSNSKDWRELVWLGRMLAEVRQGDEAEAKFRQAIKLAPQQPDGYVALVQLLARLERRDEARKVIELAEQRLPAQTRALALGQCQELLGNQARAQAQYQAALGDHPDDAATLRRVASFHIDAGQYREAEPLLRKLAEGKVDLSSSGDQAWARRYLAVVLANGTDYARFREALALVGMKLDASGQLVQERDSTLQVGSEEQRFQARVLASQQNHHRFRRRAIELLETLDRNRALTADDRFLLALLYDAEGNWNRSAVIQRDLVTRIPEPRYIAQYAQALLAHDQADQAEPWINKLEELETQRHVEVNAYASLELRARLLEARGQGDEAVAKLSKHIARRGADPDEILIVLASLARQKKFARAFEMCEAAWERKERPCRPETAGGMSVALMRAMDPKPSDPQIQRIEERLKACLVQKPDSVVLLLHLADLHDMRGHYDDAEKTYRSVLRVEPNNVVALNNLAWLLVQRSGNASEALQHIDTAVGGIGRRADLLDTRGMVRLALGNLGEALADLEEANADSPTPTRLYHLARAHFQAHDRTNAVRVLEKAQKQGLTLQTLHPIEQKPCAELFAELKVPLGNGPERKQ